MFCCVLGYLSDEGYTSSYKCFVKECPHLKEYLSLKRQGLNYPLLVNGLTLNQMLQEYAQFKLAGKLGRYKVTYVKCDVTQGKCNLVKDYLYAILRCKKSTE